MKKVDHAISLGPVNLIVGGKLLGHADNLTFDIAEASEEEPDLLKNAHSILLFKGKLKTKEDNNAK